MKKALFRFFLFIGLLSFAHELRAQEVLTYNLYSVNPFLLNPAATGCDGMLSGFVNYHNQVNDFSRSNALMTFGVHSPVGQNFSLGTSVIKDSRTALTHTYANLFLSYRLNLFQEHALVLGLSGGMVNNDFDQNKVISADQSDLMDQASTYKQTRFSGSAGLMYSYKSLQFHAAIPQFIDSNNKFSKQMNLAAFYDYSLNPTWGLKPSLMYRRLETSTPQLDFNLMGIWNKTLWAQLGVRTDQSYIASAGVNYKAFVLAYAYQMNTGKVNTVVTGAHEFQLSVRWGRAPMQHEPIVKTDTFRLVVQELKHDTVTLVKVDTVFKEREHQIATIQGTEYLTPEEISKLTPEELRSMKIVKQYYATNDLKPMLNDYQSVIGLKIKLSKINFVTDKSELTPESKQIVDSVFKLMTETPRARIQISGHTDAQGNDEYNLRLSRDRAKAVYDYLVGKGIDAKRLEYAGYGKRRPIATNTTPEGRLENRRVDFTFIE